MSFILDALRKSEQERQLVAGKSASVLHPVMADPRRPTVPWLLLVGVAVAAFVAAGLAFWWLRPLPPAPAAPAPLVLPMPVPVPPPVVAPPPTREASVVPVAPAPPAAPVAREKPQPVPEVPREAAEPQKEEALPAIVVTGYVRDGEQGGMAMVNDRLVREGEEVSPGLRLEKILPDGAVFNFRGRRFTR